MGSRSPGTYQIVALELLKRIEGDKASLCPEFRPMLERLGKAVLGMDGVSVEALPRSDQWSRFEADLERRLGWTVQAYLAELRLEPAPRLLVETDLTFAEIAGLLRYCRQADFNTSFKRRYSKSPREFRESEWLHEVPGAAIFDGAERFAQRLAESWVAKIETTAIEEACERLSSTAIMTPAVFEVLSRRSREEGRRSRSRGVELAKLAMLTITPVLGEHHQSLMALGHARLGNAFRLSGNVEEARAAFVQARLAIAPCEDARAEAEIRFLEGSFRLSCRDFEKAFELLGESLLLARAARDRDLETDIHLQIAAAHGYRGDLELRTSNLLQAWRLVGGDATADPRRKLCVCQYVIISQLDKGWLTSAKELIPEARSLAGRIGDDASLAFVGWLEGRLARALGSPFEAEEHFIIAKEAFCKVGDIEASALSALDLAILYQEEGRREDSRTTVINETIAPLEMLGLEEEKVVALALLREAIVSPEPLPLLVDARGVLQPKIPWN